MILVYHDIRENKNGETVSGLSITPKRFENHLKYLKNRYVVSSLSKMIEEYNDNKEISGQVAISFDDAFSGSFLYGYPLLKKYGFIATYFISTGYIGKSHDYLSIEQVRILNENGFEIGSHTINHKDLSSLDRNDLEKEIVESKKYIESLGIKVNLFAFPYGKNNNISIEAIKIVKKAGYICCCSTTGYSGINIEKFNPFYLTRTGINNINSLLFKIILKNPSFLLLVFIIETAFKKIYMLLCRFSFVTYFRKMIYHYMGL